MLRALPLRAPARGQLLGQVAKQLTSKLSPRHVGAIIIRIGFAGYIVLKP